MRISEIVLTNFMPYKGRQEISFPKAGAANVVVIVGDNMRGKTSFLNAIRWCMYGKAYGRHLRHIPRINLVNSDAAAEGLWNCSVQMTFEEAGTRYTLSRALKRRALIHTPRDDNDLEMLRSMTKDGTPIRDDQIESELNKFMPEQVSRFFLFDGELLQEYEMLLIEEDRQGRQLKEEIEKVLGVPAITKGRDILKALLKEAQGKLTKESSQHKDTQSMANQLESLQQQQEQHEQVLAELKGKEADLTQRISEVEQELANSEALLGKKDILDQYKNKKEIVKTRLDDLLIQKRKILKDAWRDLVAPRVRSILSDAENQLRAVDRAIERRAVVSHEIGHLTSLIENGECPTCGARIEGTHRNGLATKLGALQAELEGINADESRRASAISIQETVRKLLARCVTSRPIEVEQEIARLQVEMAHLEGQIDTIEKEIAGHDTAELARKRAYKEGLVATNARNQKSISDEEQVINDIERKKRDTATVLTRLRSAVKDKTAKYVEVYQSLENIFSESIETLRQELKEEVASKATDAFKRLTTETSYRRLTINQNYGLLIEDRNGRQVKERSAGAEQIVALALIDGLNQTAGSRGPIIMDTPFGRLDPKHRANVLKYLPDMSEQVFLLVHEGEVSKEVDLKQIGTRIGLVLSIERISSSESRIVRDAT